MEYTSKLLNQTLILYIFEGEEEETDEELTSDDVGLNCINKYQLTCLLLDVSPQSQLKRTHQN